MTPVDWSGAKKAKKVKESQPLTSTHLEMATLLTTTPLRRDAQEAEEVKESLALALVPTIAILSRPCPKIQWQEVPNSPENAFPDPPLLILLPAIFQGSLRSLAVPESGPLMAPADWSGEKEAEEMKHGRPPALIPTIAILPIPCPTVLTICQGSLRSLVDLENGSLMAPADRGGAKVAEGKKSRPLAILGSATHSQTLMMTPGY